MKLAKLQDILDNYKDGDEHGWEIEFRFLRLEHSDRIEELSAEVLRDGMKEPVLLGSDDRVWDGHHRLCVADLLGMEYVPVEFA